MKINYELVEKLYDAFIIFIFPIIFIIIGIVLVKDRFYLVISFLYFGYVYSLVIRDAIQNNKKKRDG
jgi:positive regulator of sigma E activity